ncbi:hypothetical protein AB0E25_40910 [Streptomyces bobili]|uniref:hypothetical protein n=1 Tax=Streptomyces bobili TaxID=67280 RepID=UPI0033F4E3DA
MGLIATTAFAFTFFQLLETRSTPLVFLAYVVAMPVCKDMVSGPQAALVAEQFDAKARFSGVSTGREIGGAFFGGSAPFVGTALFASTGSTDLVAVYVLAAFALTFVAVFSGRETARD